MKLDPSLPFLMLMNREIPRVNRYKGAKILIVSSGASKFDRQKMTEFQREAIEIAIFLYHLAGSDIKHAGMKSVKRRAIQLRRKARGGGGGGDGRRW